MCWFVLKSIVSGYTGGGWGVSGVGGGGGGSWCRCLCTRQYPHTSPGQSLSGILSKDFTFSDHEYVRSCRDYIEVGRDLVISL